MRQPDDSVRASALSCGCILLRRQHVIMQRCSRCTARAGGLPTSASRNMHARFACKAANEGLCTCLGLPRHAAPASRPPAAAHRPAAAAAAATGTCPPAAAATLPDPPAPAFEVEYAVTAACGSTPRRNQVSSWEAGLTAVGQQSTHARACHLEVWRRMQSERRVNLRDGAPDQSSIN